MDRSPVIQVVSDVVCPWCYIGKRRLEKAFDLLGRTDVRVHWTEGWNRRAYRAAKFGGIEIADRLQDRVVSAAVQEDLHFRFDLVEKTPNTFDAHRLIWLAGRDGLQEGVVESLFRAYFIEGRDVGDRAVLREISESHGMDMKLVDQLFATDLGVAEVSGVPTFFSNGEALTSGAHPPELLASMLSSLDRS